MSELLDVEGLCTNYGKIRILRDVSLTVGEGECVAHERTVRVGMAVQDRHTVERHRRGSVKIASDGAYDFADLFGRIGCADDRDRRR